MTAADNITLKPGQRESRFRLPVQDAEFSLSRGTLSKRLVSLGAIGWGLLCLLTPLLLTGGRAPRLPRFAGDSIDSAIAMVYVVVMGFLLLMTLGGWAMACSLFLSFFPKHVVFEVSNGSIGIRSRQGPWRRTRRIKNVRSLRISSPARIGHAWMGKPLESRKSRLLVDRDEGTVAATLIEDRPYAQVKELAAALAEAVARHDGITCPLHDQVDPMQRQRDAEAPPRGTRFRVEQRGENVAILPVAAKPLFRSLLRDGTFRSGIWMALLPYPLFVGMINLSPEAFDIARPLAPKIALGGLAYGLFFMSAAWYALALRRSYLITPEHLIRLTDVRMRCRSSSWKRADIAAVRVGQSIADQGRPFDVLELVLRSGETVKLQSGSLDCVQYLATLLRKTLGVSAEPPARAAIPAIPPANCPFVIHRGHGRVGATKTAPGWTAAHQCCVAVGAAVMAGSIAALLLGWKHLDAECRGVAVLLALAFGAMVAILVIAAAFEATNYVRLWFDDMNGLDFVSASIFGTRRLRLRHHEVEKIAAEPAFAGNPKGQTRLVVVRAKDERTILLNGSADLIRYLADALTLDARGEQPAAERIQAKR